MSPKLSETWRYALIGGLVALPGTTYLYWQSGTELSLGPVLVGGVVAGYLHAGDRSVRRSIGARTGLIGGLPALWMLADALAVVPGVGGPTWFKIVAGGMGVGASLAFTLLAFGLSALIGVLGAGVGGWLSRRTGRNRSSVTGT